MLDGHSQFFIGVVISSDAATYSTQVEPFGRDLKSPMQGIPLAGVFATALGFKECPPISPGASVLCYVLSFDTCYIIGVIPDSDYGDLSLPSRACLKTADGNFDKQNYQGYNDHSSKKATQNQNRPTDVIDGEYVVSNEFGVLLGLFQQLAVLKASELAQVQCFLLDDLVRIISHNYEHLHALGELKIFHDGRALMAEFGATHDPREAMGIPQVKEDNDKIMFKKGKPPNNKGDDTTDFYDFSEDERSKAIERVKLFVGKLGDFIHMFLVRPDEEAVRALAGELKGKHDTGLADLHVGLDGRINVRTVTGAAIEKTNWIRVPHRVRVAEDPKGDDDISYESKDPFVFDDSKKVRGNPSLYFLQMRDCNAYLQDLYNFKNFVSHEKDFKLSKGADDEETKLSEISEVDPKTKVNLNNYQLRRSGIYLMDNGGIMLKDAWDSALVMEGGDIYIQPAKDLLAQPLRNYIAKAGKFISMTARKDIDMSSSEEGFRLKTDKTQHFYSDKEGIILQSNSEQNVAPLPEDTAYNKFGGLLFKSKKGVYTYGEKIFDRAEKEALYKAESLMLETTEKSLSLRSGQHLEVIVEDKVDFVAQGIVNIVSLETLNLVAESSLNMVGNKTLLGKQGEQIGMQPHPGSIPAALDGVLPLDTYIQAAAGVLDRKDTNDFQKRMTPFDLDETFTEIKFRFLSSDKYQLMDGQDFIPQTLSQQDDIAFGFLGLTAWNEPEINETLPFPGKDKFETYYVTCEVKNLRVLENDLFSKEVKEIKPKGGNLQNATLQQYTVAK